MRKDIQLKILLAATVALATILLIVLISDHYARTQHAIEIQRLSRTYEIDAYGLWRYGIIESIDQKEKTMLITLATNFGNGRIGRTFKIRTTPDTAIRQQTFVKDAATYTGLTPLVPINFENLRSGMYVATTIINTNQSEPLIARTIIVGDPL